MPEKVKSSASNKSFAQGIIGGQLVGWFRLMLLFVSFAGMLSFWSETRPTPDAIATIRNFEMPDSVENAYHYNHLSGSPPVISRFTIDASDVNQLLASFEEDSLESCLVEHLDKSYLPDFTLTPQFDWWNPQGVIAYQGADCWRNFGSDRTKHVLLLIDYSVMGEATFYFEQHYIEDGERIGFE